MFIKVAVDAGVSAAVIAATRVALGALVLLPLAFSKARMAGLRFAWRPLLAVAVLDVAAPFLLVPWAEQTVSSGLAGIVVATSPLFVAALAWRFDRSERISAVQVLGLGVGFGGVIVVGWGGAGGSWLGVALLLAAAFGYAVATVLIKLYLADLSPIGVSAGALSVSTLLLIGPAAASFDPVAMFDPGVMAALAVLGVACTGLAFWAYYALINEAGAARASVSIYPTPAVAVILGAVFLDERVTVGIVVGLVLILAGSWLSTRPWPSATGASSGDPDNQRRGGSPCHYQE